MRAPADSSAAGGRQRDTSLRPGLVALAMVAVAANLRTVMASLPPLVDEVSSALDLSNVQVGVLTTLPVLCMGLFAPMAHRVSARLGPYDAVLGGTVLLVIGTASRGLGPAWSLYAGSFLAGVGIATTGTLLPGLVKAMFPPERAGTATGLYMLAMSAGAAASAALAVPLAAWLGSWQASLASWSLLAAMGLVAWFSLRRAVARTGEHRPPRERSSGLPWRHATAWWMAAYMAAGSWQFYSSLAWLAPSLVASGWPPRQAGYLLSVYSAVQVLSGLLVPTLADRVVDRRRLILPACLSALIGEVGLWTAPTAAPWLWAIALGLGQGAIFSLGLVLLVSFAVSPAGSARLSGLVLGVSYTVAALGPTVMGGIRDLTDGFSGVWVALAGVMLVQILLATRLGPHRRRVT